MASTQIRAGELRKVLILGALFAFSAPIALGQFGGLKKKLSKIGEVTPHAAKAAPQGPAPGKSVV